MASADQIKALLQAHADGDDDRFYSVAMQVAAHEARMGHGKLARDLRDIIDAAKSTRDFTSLDQVAIGQNELFDIVQSSYPKNRFGDLILDDALMEQIKRVVREHRSVSRILEHGLSPRRKLLLVGPPGTGKTLTASVLAGELGLPLLEIRLDWLLTRFIGETVPKLSQIWEATIRTRGVYFFDKLEVICSHKISGCEAAERRQIFNSFVVMAERNDSRSIIVAATKHVDDLDIALFSKFDDVLEYKPPNESQIAELLELRLHGVAAAGVAWQKLAELAVGMNLAEVSGVANEVLKVALISGVDKASESDIDLVLRERKRISERKSTHSD